MLEFKMKDTKGGELSGYLFIHPIADVRSSDLSAGAKKLAICVVLKM